MDDAKKDATGSPAPMTIDGEQPLDSLIADYGVRIQPVPTSDGGMVVGEVLDTHHPHRPGRVLVRWLDAQGSTHEHWLPRMATVPATIGARVLLNRPSNWPEWLVVGTLAATAAEVREASPAPAHVVRLESGESVRIENAQGVALFELSAHEGKPVLRLHDDLHLDIAGTFGVRADRIELESGQGGTDARSDGEMIFRSPRIRLN